MIARLVNFVLTLRLTNHIQFKHSKFRCRVARCTNTLLILYALDRSR